ncbi:MAG: hypothetical protein ACXW2E_00915 [Nitrososphaeraceae archaeon]
MELIKKINSIINQQVNEDDAGSTGAVSACDVASSSMPLFATLVKRNIPSHPRIIKFSTQKKPKKFKFHNILNGLTEQMANNPDFDTSEVVAKLKSLENQESVDYRDTTIFGLVDNNGKIIKVTLPNDQSQGFEQDIQHFLGARDETEQAPEVAEILFKLKDRYTIINVEWPQVEEEQEESQELANNPEGENPPEGDLPPEDDLPPQGPETENTGQVQSLLTQVIDMMKADATARKAEAQAREAEAKTKQAEAARNQAMARVKQEEQFMDMDVYNKAQKEKEKEAKRLAQLAKWKHDMQNGEEELPAQDPQYDFLPGEENEEIFKSPAQQKPQQTNKVVRGKVTPTDIAKFISSRIK